MVVNNLAFYNNHIDLVSANIAVIHYLPKDSQIMSSPCLSAGGYLFSRIETCLQIYGVNLELGNQVKKQNINHFWAAAGEAKTRQDEKNVKFLSIYSFDR